MIAAGKRLQKDGAKKVICVIQEQGQVALEVPLRRRQGGLQGAVREPQCQRQGHAVGGVDDHRQAPAGPKSIDHVVTLGAPIALTAVQSATMLAVPRQVVTFDTNAALVDAIKDGSVQWAVDQQPYLQGYLAIDSLWLYLNNKNVIGGGEPTLTGPSFIDKTNIDSVAELAKAGTR